VRPVKGTGNTEQGKKISRKGAFTVCGEPSHDPAKQINDLEGRRKRVKDFGER